MTLPDDVALPAEPDAYVVSPALISDRSVELGPAYSGTGPTLADGHVIGADHSHSPITFDTMLGSLSTLTSAIGPQQGDIGAVLTRGADQWRDQGKLFNSAMRNLSAASGVLGARAEDIGAVVDNPSTPMAAFNQRQVSLNQMVDELGQVGGSWADANVDIAQPMADLKVVLDQVDTFVTQHGDDLGTIAANLNAVGDVLTAKQPQLAEFMDLVPLMMQNLSNTASARTGAAGSG